MQNTSNNKKNGSCYSAATRNNLIYPSAQLLNNNNITGKWQQQNIQQVASQAKCAPKLVFPF